ncbi:ShlB/FhaC/HecB family hemolysin secretion/activation protein [Burkholderia ambifaria]|uniref:ShlB/FhaC/HecB family hemolysin secretion/activation protein n=1 Tax=Burkholderia ambifaria TaxID=152480 RepID=UPI001E472BE1|nr:ShlB/FhaC/HecB family hemolysin secretion/activation protein [Burkholderia ambifaria]UEP23694.1 ShlB/FhaC/HecB family hemolysin secretion/activation protein [Burkholderia ambifaria]
MQDRAWHAALAAVFEIRAGASNTEPTAPARMQRIGPVLILGVVIRSANRIKIQKIRQNRRIFVLRSYLFNIHGRHRSVASPAYQSTGADIHAPARRPTHPRWKIRSVRSVIALRGVRDEPTQAHASHAVRSPSLRSPTGRRAGPLTRSAIRAACATGAALSLHGVAHAQLPGAGQSLRDVETVRPALPAPAAPDLAIPARRDEPAPAASEAGPRVSVHAFDIEGNRAIDTARLRTLLDDLVGRDLSFAELQQAAGRITTYYREHGYVLARAYLPHQDIENGVVRIAISEGRYGHIELHNRSRVLDGVLGQPLGALQPGAVVRGADLERSLMLLDELPGVDARGTLRAGAQPGTTDLVIDAERGRFATGSVELDNFGDPLTGHYRATGSLTVNSPLTLGDQLTLRGLTSNTNQRYYRAAYQLPVGPASTRVGVGYSEMAYRLNGTFRPFGYHGRASVQSAFVTQPLVRTRRANVTAQVLYENKNLHDDYGVFEFVGDKNVGLWSFSVSGYNEDDAFGGGRNSFSATLGVGRMRGNDPLEMNTFAKTHGSFTKLSLNALRLQALGARFQFYTQFSAQLASRNLDASEKFTLGGPYGVRAYALSAGSGDQGWQATAELRYLAAPGWQLSTFVDTGRMQINKQPWRSNELNTLQLSATGVGLSWYAAKRQASLTAAWPLGTADDVPTVTRGPSIWLQAAQYF